MHLIIEAVSQAHIKYDPEKYHRRSIRLKNYDYTTPGAYFITLCTFKMECIRGEIRDG